MNILRKNVFVWRKITALGLLALIVSTGYAQQSSAKRPLTLADADSWRAIQGQSLSRDGRFVVYALVPQEGDGEVVVRNLATGAEWRASRGAAPINPPQRPQEGEPGLGPGQGFGQGQFAGRPMFTADVKFVVFQILPSKAETDKAKKEKKRPDEMPKNGMGIMDLATGEVTRIERVKNFQVPDEGAGFIAYSLEAKPEERKPEDRRAEGGAPPATSNRGRRDPRRKEYGTDLVLRNMSDKSERTFADVLDYSLSKDAKTLVFGVASKKDDTNGAFAVSTSSADAPVALLSGKGKYTRFTWDEKQTQLVLLSDRDDVKSTQPKLKLYRWDRKAATATEIVSTSSPNFKQGYVINERGPINFSQDGSKVFFGVAPPGDVEKEEVDDAAAADDKVSVDLWHWKDDYIQPMQKVRAEQDRNRSYRAVFHFAENKYVQLGDETMQGVSQSSDGRWALGSDDRPYRILVGYDDDANAADVSLINTTDGSRKPLMKRHARGFTWSPGGHYALFYDGKDWNTLSIPDCKIVNLTKNLGVNFWRESHDSPSTPPAYGNAGWTSDDKYVLLYDKYDIWQITPDGSSAKNLTDGVGRKEKIEFRYARVDPQEKGIDPSKPILLRAENEWTRDSGFYRDKIDGGLPEKLIMEAKDFNPPTRAKEVDVYLMTASTFSEFPDLLVTSNFKDLKKVSDANPQKAGMVWGSSELVRFKNTDGVPLSAMLIKPANFDPSKKYPMIVYIYETLSENVHHFVDPRPSHNINASYYASNGYLVLEPDIVYTIGHPGQSALNCVLPAIQSVVDKGFVDEKAIGIQGHSWGGYQIAYMITQTTRFKAAAAGAPVANMTSAYSGIRWGTGLPRQFQYEHTQSRIGGNLWEAPMLYLENSPVFRADRVHTPLMMIHNDADDAVPWYQGIEYYLALRRLGREAYLFSYNGEPHGLRKRQNQKDYSMRLQQFFNHFLKGAPAPEWMIKGIPYLQKDKEKEQYKVTADLKEKAGN
jgi:dipeptidyl aminopeptidase/acylaminoacyl peptidase